MASELCSACSNITLSMLIDGFQHPLDYNQVLQSKEHCRLCEIVSNAYKSQTCVKYDNLTALRGDKTKACKVDHRGPLMWRLQQSEPGARWGMFKLDSQHYGGLHRISVSEESSVFKNRIITHRDLQDANSPRNMRLLREWLQECQLQHDECGRGTYSGNKYNDGSSSTTLPFRVIDVGFAGDGRSEEKKPRVYTTHGKETGRYMTLSHCWGKVIPPRMTKDTVDAWQVELPLANLPKTFRDAIWLTRELGERFLWIDSICIVQDDPTELMTQIGLMGVIFEESFCTIAAVDAKGSDGSQMVDSGLFVSGPAVARTAKFQVKTAGTNNDGLAESTMGTSQSSSQQEVDELCEVIMQEASDTADPFPLRLQFKAWHSRGWVFQERELSRRCIFFTEYDLGWRCNRYWETEQTGIPECRRPRGEYTMDGTKSYGGVSYDAEYNLRKTWQNTVQQYSVTKLTYNSDKHNALMGFEERLATRFGYKFYHGIVDFGHCEHLHSQLLWVPAISRGGLNDIPFPSWSWMNLKGAVKWPHDEYLVYPELLAKVMFGAPKANEEAQELQISGPFQSIRVGARIGDIPHYTERERWAPDTHFGWSELGMHPDTNTLLSSKDDQVIGWVALDADLDSEDIFAFPLLRYLRQDDEVEPMCVDFLAVSGNFTRPELNAPEKKEPCRRVGRGRVLKRAFEWLDDCQDGSIVLN
ncbi:HET domain-containing protein [Fusarium keratoplasticum]|nr:HET domain-containing protein [Fusarium keratoplasticum]